MRWLVIAPLLVGCMKQNPDYCPNHPMDPRCGGTGSGDAAVDTKIIDGDPGRLCFGTGNYEVCLASPLSGTVTLTGSLDTTDGQAMCLQMQPMGWTTRGQPASCFVVATTVTVNDVSVSGARPLVIVADTIEVNGHLDAAGHEAMPTKRPPGAPYGGLSCTAFGQTPTNSGSGAGGGAGGSFMRLGGDGGAGNNGQAGNKGGIAAPAETSDPVALRGGCDGQSGGNAAATGGVGGSGGGAVYLVAGTAITFSSSGIINASGGGGHANTGYAGGGGGGAGGMIVLDAANISGAAGRLLANGGGGASGGNNGGGTAGIDPPFMDPLTQAGSVVGPMNCCTGAKGYANEMMAESSPTAPAGLSGGGGGGGGGYIQSNKQLGTMVSPPPTIK